MRSVRDELRQLVESFEPRSKEYWLRVGGFVARRLPPGAAIQARSGFGAAGRACGAAAGFFLREVVPIVPGIREGRRYLRAIARERGRDEVPEEFRPYEELPRDALKDSLKIEVSRREQFTRKAQAYLMAVTLGTSFTIGVLGVLGKAAVAPPAVLVPLKVVLVGLVLSLVIGLGTGVGLAFYLLR